jgi:N-acetylmuramoyl-L-alanine amidase
MFSRSLACLMGVTLAALLCGAPLARAEKAAAAEGGEPHTGNGSSIGGNHLQTRFVIGLAKPVEFQVFSLSNPNRVVVELPDTGLSLPSQPNGQPIGLVQGFRGGVSAPGRARIVIEVTKPVVVESARIEKGKDGRSSHLAIEIVPVQAVNRKSLKQQPFALGAAAVQPPLPKPAMRPELRADSAFKPIIVIDPGHGGTDSGATKNGTIEKDVVLAFSMALRDRLTATGLYKVLMTRDTDVFVELDERRAFAERHNANLFIAVHADYAGSNARGATIFSLRENVAKELRRSAKGGLSRHLLSSSEAEAIKEAEGDVDTVRGILSDLAEREVDATSERSSMFARSVIEYMGAKTSLRDNPDQQAAFRVLKTAQFPSVLIELAYVTNSEDARNLKSETWREKVANSIVTAVENYFSHQVARLPM